MSTFGDPTYYTAAVDNNSIDGQVSHQVVRSSSLRQVMRSAADQPPEAEISVYQHTEACREATGCPALLALSGTRDNGARPWLLQSPAVIWLGDSRLRCGANYTT
jgi:hypothetical protein